VESGAARRLAGGPLAFTALELILRWPGACHRTAAPLAAVDSWAARAPSALQERIAVLGDRLTAARRAPAAPRLLGIAHVPHAAVMRLALDAGIDIINDVSALTHDPDSLAVAAASRASIVLMHMPGVPATMNRAPTYDDVALDVFDHLETRIAACVAAGIAPE